MHRVSFAAVLLGVGLLIAGCRCCPEVSSIEVASASGTKEHDRRSRATSVDPDPTVFVVYVEVGELVRPIPTEALERRTRERAIRTERIEAMLLPLTCCVLGLEQPIGSARELVDRVSNVGCRDGSCVVEMATPELVKVAGDRPAVEEAVRVILAMIDNRRIYESDQATDDVLPGPPILR